MIGRALVGQSSCINNPKTQRLVKKHQNVRLKAKKDYELNFSISQFLKTFVIHVLYYGVLGPFLIPISLCFKGGFNRMYNMSFANPCIMDFYTQFGTWLAFIMVLKEYVFCKLAIGPANPICDLHIFDTPLILSIMVCVMTRSLQIGSKYGTYPKRYYDTFSVRKYTKAELGRELIMQDWRWHKYAIVEAELHNAFRRMDVDNSIMYLCFFSKMPVHIETELKKIYDQNQVNDTDGYSKMVEYERMQVHYYDARFMMHYLIDMHETKFTFWKGWTYYWICFILSALRTLLSGIVRVLYLGQPFLAPALLPNMTLFMALMNVWMFFSATYAITGMAFQDSSRSIFL